LEQYLDQPAPYAVVICSYF